MAIIGVSLLLAIIPITLIIVGLRHAAMNKEFASIPNTNSHRHLVIRSPAQPPVKNSQDPPATEDTDPLTDPSVVSALKPLFAKYDFEAMANLIRNKYSSGSKSQALISEYQGLGSLMSWIDGQLDKTTSESPISINDINSGQEMLIFRTNANNNSIVLKSPTASQVLEFNKLSPQQMLAVEKRS